MFEASGCIEGWPPHLGFRVYIGYILGLYRNNGKENGYYNLGFRVYIGATLGP